MNSVVKGNRPLRIFAGLMLLILIVSHFMKTIDLTEPSILWIMILISVNALQASFTGFCPMFKDKNGNCVACGVQCSDESSGCCDTSTSCCDTSTDCCSSEKNNNEKADNELVIKVLGTGCANCTNTAKLIQTTAKELDVDVNIIKVEEITDIVAHGVMNTPAVVINNQVVHSGGIPSKNLIKDWLLSHQNKD